MLHEYGHFVQFTLNGLNWAIPDGCGWTAGTGADPDCSHGALCEGWASYFPVMLYNSTVNPNDHSFDSSYPVRYSQDFGSERSDARAETNLWNFARALYNLYDDVNSTNDTLAYRDSEIFLVFKNDKPKTVEDFFMKYASRFPEDATDLEQIYRAVGMHPDWLTLSTTNLDFGPTLTTTNVIVGHQKWYGAFNRPVKPEWFVSPDTSWIGIGQIVGSTELNQTTSLKISVLRDRLQPGINEGHIEISPSYYGLARVIDVKAQK